jgi:hypothetical protein
MELFDDKIIGRKSRDRVPLRDSLCPTFFPRLLHSNAYTVEFHLRPDKLFYCGSYNFEIKCTNRIFSIVLILIYLQIDLNWTNKFI